MRVFWKQLYWFQCKLEQVVHGARRCNGQSQIRLEVSVVHGARACNGQPRIGLEVSVVHGARIGLQVSVVHGARACNGQPRIRLEVSVVHGGEGIQWSTSDQVRGLRRPKLDLLALCRVSRSIQSAKPMFPWKRGRGAAQFQLPPPVWWVGYASSSHLFLFGSSSLILLDITFWFIRLGLLCM